MKWLKGRGEFLTLVGLMITLAIWLKVDIQDIKSDMRELRTELKSDIAALRTELKDDIAALRTELKDDIRDLRLEIGEVRSMLMNHIAIHHHSMPTKKRANTRTRNKHSLTKKQARN